MFRKISCRKGGAILTEPYTLHVLFKKKYHSCSTVFHGENNLFCIFLYFLLISCKNNLCLIFLVLFLDFFKFLELKLSWILKLWKWGIFRDKFFDHLIFLRSVYKYNLLSGISKNTSGKPGKVREFYFTKTVATLLLSINNWPIFCSSSKILNIAR